MQLTDKNKSGPCQTTAMIKENSTQENGILIEFLRRNILKKEKLKMLFNIRFTEELSLELI